jgi:predicted amidophosphoribosyltransferase
VHWLVKVRDTAAQAQADRTQRWKQLQGSMAIGRAHQAALQGARVLLVDDVMTTGATLEAASRCALHAGAVRVDVVVFARTPQAG